MPTAELVFFDGVNVVWGASNTGKSFIVKAFDFMTGAGVERLPDVKQRQGYDQAWLQMALPNAGQVTLARATAGGNFDLYDGWVEPSSLLTPVKTLSSEHNTKDKGLSGLLLREMGIENKKIAKNQYGEKQSFTFRYFAPYMLTEENDMMGDWSPIRLSEYKNDTLDKNVLKFIVTGVDDSAIVATPTAKSQTAGNNGKKQLVDEMIATASAEYDAGFSDSGDLEDQLDKIEITLSTSHRVVAERQAALDNLRQERRVKMEALADANERATEIVLALKRFETLRTVYDSDIERLKSLQEGGTALLIGFKRPCALCGADFEHQHSTHGLDEIDQAQRAVDAEIAKILAERSDLQKAIASLNAEREAMIRRAERLVGELVITNGTIEEVRPLEASTRAAYEQVISVREKIKAGIALKSKIEELKLRRVALEEFKAVSPKRGSVVVGISTVIGHELAMSVQSVLRAWEFPGEPVISFDEKTHDMLINGSSRSSNGKGVRALLNSAFKLGLLIYCKKVGRPHPGVIVLDSPLLSYREPLTSKHGELSADEQVVKASGVKERFYEFLAANTALAQFIVIENDPPAVSPGPEVSITMFTGTNEGRWGFFPSNVSAQT